MDGKDKLFIDNFKLDSVCSSVFCYRIRISLSTQLGMVCSSERGCRNWIWGQHGHRLCLSSGVRWSTVEGFVWNHRILVFRKHGFSRFRKYNMDEDLSV